MLALLTRGLHLDGLADTADGLGPLRDRERALQVMHQSDVGPFGVVTLVLTLLLQVACAAALLAADDGWLRALDRGAWWPGWRWRGPACRAWPSRRAPRSAGRSPARCRRVWLAAAVLVSAALVAGAALLVGDPADAVGLLVAARGGAARRRGAAPPRDGAARRDHRRRHGRDGRGGDDGVPAGRRRALVLGAARHPPRVDRGWDHGRVTTPFAGTLLGTTIAAVTPRDAAAERAARERLDG